MLGREAQPCANEHVGRVWEERSLFQGETGFRNAAADCWVTGENQNNDCSWIWNALTVHMMKPPLPPAFSEVVETRRQGLLGDLQVGVSSWCRGIRYWFR